MMLIPKDTLLDFVNKVGFSITEGCIMRLRNNSITCYGANLPSTTAFNIKYNGLQTKEGEEIGIKSLCFLQQIIKGLKSHDIEVNIVDNMICILDGNKEFKLSLVDPKMLDAMLMEAPTYPYNIYLDTVELKGVVKSCKLFGKFVTVVVKDKNLIFRAGETDKVIETIRHVAKDGSVVEFFLNIEFLEDLVKVLTEDRIMVSVGEDVPFRITEMGSNFNAEYYIAVCKDE